MGLFAHVLCFLKDPCKGGAIVQIHRLPNEQLMPMLMLQLQNGGKATLIVHGYSMLPMLRNGRDSVLLQLPDAAPKKRDIVLFQRQDGSYVLHRIVKCTADGYLCCGDHQCVPEAIQPAQVLAVVSDYIRNGKQKSCGAKGYRLYAWLWTATFFARRPILFCCRLCGKVRRFIRRLF